MQHLHMQVKLQYRAINQVSPDDAVSAVIPGAVLYIPFAELVDIDKEIERLKKEEGRLNGEIKRCEGMLGNEKFISKAPQAKIDEEKAKLEKYQQMLCTGKRTFTGTYKVIYVKRQFHKVCLAHDNVRKWRLLCQICQACHQYLNGRYSMEMRSGKLLDVDEGFTQLLGYTDEDIKNGLIFKQLMPDVEYNEIIADLRAKFIREPFCMLSA